MIKRSICGIEVDFQKRRGSYIKYKIGIMYQIGMRNKDKLNSYLESETANIKNDVLKERCIDALCRVLIKNYLNGDKTFI